MALAAARAVGLTPDRVVLLAPETSHHCTVDMLVRGGLAQKQQFRERTFKPGEAKTKLALLSFSSGTTGKPKAVAISHYAVIANIIQMATHQKGRFQPGDVALSGTLYYIMDAVVDSDCFAVLPFFRKLCLFCEIVLLTAWERYIRSCSYGRSILDNGINMCHW